MATDVTYGGYSFSPKPSFKLGNEPIFLSGKLDYLKQSISLNGQLTGCNLTMLKLAKESLVLALSTGFQQLTIGNTGFSYAKPISINFADSELTKVLPYDITFEAYQNNSFSQFYGIINPVDKWSFKEGEGRVVSATHNVEGTAIKTDANSFLKVKNFVDGRLKGFENISLFFTGTSFILESKSETLNNVSNTYSVSETWSLSQLGKYDRADSIVRPTAQITFSDNSLSVSVAGTIKGGISGTADTGYFTPNDAAEFVKNATQNVKSLLENDYYDSVVTKPVGYTYTINSGANSIDFDFRFNDPTNPDTGDVKHEYKVTFSANKEQLPIQASIDGTVSYNGIKDVFLTAQPENEVRYQKVQEFFSGVNPFALIQSHFSFFNSANLPYSKKPLNPIFISSNVDKDPFNSSITYNYSYNNKVDIFNGYLINPSVSISTVHSIINRSIAPTINGGFCTQDLFRTLDRKTITINGNFSTGANLQTTITYLSGWMNKYETFNSKMISNSLTTGDSNLSMSRSYIYK